MYLIRINKVAFWQAAFSHNVNSQRFQKAGEEPLNNDNLWIVLLIILSFRAVST